MARYGSRQWCVSPSGIFFQIAIQRNIYANPLLDFLSPNAYKHACGYRALPRFPFLRNSQRAYTVSTRRSQTTAIYNSCKDAEGLDMRIEITSRASNRLKEIMVQDSNPNLALRINVENGGCHGFQYLMSLITLPDLQIGPTADTGDEIHTRTSNLSIETPVCKPHHTPNSGSVSNRDESSNRATSSLQDDDVVFIADDGSGAKVVMNVTSLNVLKGSKVDYITELIGSQFKIIDNPLAISSCGCGTSFDIKM